MDFFDQQDQARKKTTRLLALYALAVASIIIAIYLVLVFLIGSEWVTGEPGTQALWNPPLLGGVMLVILPLVLISSAFKVHQLSKGGSIVATSLGGRPLQPDTSDPNERKLLNVVEEMALASGIAVPQVYLLDNEKGINAFAAGFSTCDAVIGVTRGCIDTLTRDELQGVVAHEFSHIVNGDMRLNIKLMGILFGIIMLTVVGRIMLRSALYSSTTARRRSGQKGVNPIPFIGLALMIIGTIGVFFANLIKSAISRQREFLSDACAVQYTRNPSGLAGALKKIATVPIGANVRNAHASEASHLFFGSISRFSWGSLFSTHPPIQKRLQRLDASLKLDREQAKAVPTSSTAHPSGLSMLSADTSSFKASNAGTVNMQAANTIMKAIPEELYEQAHHPVGARALIYTLVWPKSHELEELAQEACSADPQALALISHIKSRMQDVPRFLYLPLADLTVSALRLLPKPQYETFKQTVEHLTHADEKISLFEFAMTHLLLRHVDTAFYPTAPSRVRQRTLEAIRSECQQVLAGLAAWGPQDDEASALSYQEGCKALGFSASTLDSETVTLEKISNALTQLSQASPSLKYRFIEACALCTLADGNVADDQGDLLRAIADAIDVPMPPLLDQKAA